MTKNKVSKQISFRIPVDDPLLDWVTAQENINTSLKLLLKTVRREIGDIDYPEALADGLIQFVRDEPETLKTAPRRRQASVLPDSIARTRRPVMHDGKLSKQSLNQTAKKESTHAPTKNNQTESKQTTPVKTNPSIPTTESIEKTDQTEKPITLKQEVSKPSISDRPQVQHMSPKPAPSISDNSNDDDEDENSNALNSMLHDMDNL